jgi:hypothetical protein
VSELGQKLKEKTPSLIGGALATVSVSIITSWLGTKAGLISIGCFSVVSGWLAATYEHGLSRSARAARRVRKSAKERLGTHGSPYEHLYRPKKKSIPYKLITVCVVATGALSIGVLTAVEAVAGKPATAIVHGTKGSGFTVGHNTVYTPPPPAPSPSYTPTIYPTPSTSTPIVATPSPTTTTPTPSPSSSTTLISPTATPSPTESAIIPGPSQSGPVG